MAQRTGADGLIAPKVKATSTRVLLVLVAAAALGLSGCGGGSDEQSASTAASAGSGAGSGQKAASEEQGESLPTDAEESNNAKVKQGPGIAPPKGPPEKGSTPKEEESATEADISLRSPALGETGEGVQSIPAEYTCDGTDSWPELKWSGVPTGTEELILFVLNLEPIDQALFFDWAVAGIDPSLEGIEEGTLPPGVILGKNSFGKQGYSICPEGEAETYVFSLYALPKSLSPAKGFDPMTLRNQVLEASGNVGLLVASYVRG